jgi:hypothetical protein
LLKNKIKSGKKKNDVGLNDFSGMCMFVGL